MDRFRFVDGASALRLELLNANGWYLGKGLDLGRRTTERTYLNQKGVDGAVLVAADLEIRTMTIPLHMAKQGNATAMLALYEDLVDELDRETNIIELRPTGFGTSFLIDTYRGDGDSLFHDANFSDVFKKLRTGEPVVVTLERAPKSRGAGTYL